MLAEKVIPAIFFVGLKSFTPSTRQYFCLYNTMCISCNLIHIFPLISNVVLQPFPSTTYCFIPIVHIYTLQNCQHVGCTLPSIAFSIRNISLNYSSKRTFFYISASPTIQGYVHLLSTIKTASNTTTKYFDLKLQTSENEAVRAVCFSPEKRLTLHQLQQKKSPVKIVGAQLSSSKRFSSSVEEYTISKKSKITRTTLQFPF